MNVKVVPTQISDFRMSPGLFVLNPHLELHQEPDDMLLVGESSLRKSGDDPQGWIDQVEKAQKLLGSGQSFSDFRAGKPATATIWRHTDEE